MILYDIMEDNIIDIIELSKSYHAEHLNNLERQYSKSLIYFNDKPIKQKIIKRNNTFNKKNNKNKILNIFCYCLKY